MLVCIACLAPVMGIEPIREQSRELLYYVLYCTGIRVFSVDPYHAPEGANIG